MFNIPSIQTDFRTLVGWRQNPDPQARQLTGLLTSGSGIYMQDVHPMLTLRNLASFAPDFSQYTYPDWNAGTAYTVGTIVVESGKQFKCIADAVAGTLTTDTDFWQPWSADKAFTNWLQDKMDGATSLFINDWLGRKFKDQSARNIVERERLYTATGNNETLSDKEGDRMNGMEFSVFRSLGARAKISEFSLHLTDNQSLTVYLYKTGQREPVYSENVNYTAAGSVQWFPVEWEMKGEGAYYLCYNEKELTGRAYNDAPEHSAWSTGWQMPSMKYVNIHPFTAPIEDLAGVDFDIIGDTLVVGDTEYFQTNKLAYHMESAGLNATISVECDLTDFVIQQRKKFAQAYSLYLAKVLLQTLGYNPEARINRNENNVDPDAVRYELNGVAMNNHFSLAKQYERAVAAIKFDTTNVDELCLPCARKKGLMFTTTG